MCLDRVEEVPESMREGQAIKYLRKNEDGSYNPEWEYFRVGSGGIFNPEYYPISEIIKNEVVYRLGETYRVDHCHKCGFLYRQEKYPAGVHLYLEEDNDENKDYLESTEMVRVLCEYKRAVAWDGEFVIVAMEVTPIREL